MVLLSNASSQSHAQPSDKESEILMNFGLMRFERFRKQRELIEERMLHKSNTHVEQYTEDIYRSIRLSRTICAYIDEPALKRRGGDIKEFIQSFKSGTEKISNCGRYHSCDEELHRAMRIATRIQFNEKDVRNRMSSFWQEYSLLHKLNATTAEQSHHILENVKRVLAVHKIVTLFNELEYLEKLALRVQIAMDTCGVTVHHEYRTETEWVHAWFTKNIQVVAEERTVWSTIVYNRSISDVQVMWYRSDVLRNKVCSTLDMSIFDSAAIEGHLKVIMTNLEGGATLEMEMQRINAETYKYHDAYDYKSLSALTNQQYGPAILNRFAAEFHRLISEIATEKGGAAYAYQSVMATVAKQRILPIYRNRIAMLRNEAARFDSTCRHRSVVDNVDEFDGTIEKNTTYTNNNATDVGSKTVVVIIPRDNNTVVITENNGTVTSKPKTTVKTGTPTTHRPKHVTSSSGVTDARTKTTENGVLANNRTGKPSQSASTTESVHNEITTISDIDITEPETDGSGAITDEPEKHTTGSGTVTDGLKKHTTGPGKHTTETEIDITEPEKDGSGAVTDGPKKHTTRSGKHTTETEKDGSGAVTDGPKKHTTSSGKHTTETEIDITEPETDGSGSVTDGPKKHTTSSGNHTTETEIDITEPETDGSGEVTDGPKKHTTVSGKHTTETEIDITEPEKDGSGEVTDGPKKHTPGSGTHTTDSEIFITVTDTDNSGSGKGTDSVTTDIHTTVSEKHTTESGKHSTVGRKSTHSAAPSSTATPSTSTMRTTTEKLNSHCMFPFVYRRRMYMDCVLVRGKYMCGSHHFKNGTFALDECTPTAKPPKEVCNRI